MVHPKRWLRVAWFAASYLAAACNGAGDEGHKGGARDAGHTANTDAREASDAATSDAAALPATPEEICADICIVLQAEEDCHTWCVEDLADCSDDDLGVLAACTRAGDAPYCIDDVECFSGDPTPAPRCFDGTCDPGENCETCPNDCGECFCGDGQCQVDEGESCEYCPEDCGGCFCGDGRCSPGECTTCGTDCPDGCFCPHDECTPGERLDLACSECVAAVCQWNGTCCEQSWAPYCARDAERTCGIDCAPFCGDLTCDEGENSVNCAMDCPYPRCGDGACTEGCGFCPEDCGECVCGNGECEIGECGICESDCPGCACPHDACTIGEPLVRTCGVCEARVCSALSFCCSEAWSDICVLLADAWCNDCSTSCGDGICSGVLGETCESCPTDCCPGG